MLVTGMSDLKLQNRVADSRTVSANDTIRDQVRDLVQRNVDFGVELMELDYQPVESRSIWSLKRDEVRHSDVV